MACSLITAGERVLSINSFTRRCLFLAIGGIILNGPEVDIPAPIVQPLALIIHELVVNAATHGALSRQVGKLNVSWQGTSQNDGFELRWQETGGPPPPLHRQCGFGTVIIDGMIDKQLKGKIDRHWIETGLMMTITVPWRSRQ
jgi:two-component sensor histidine kinase